MPADRDLIAPAQYRSTSRRWALVSGIVVLVLSGALFASLRIGVETDESRVGIVALILVVPLAAGLWGWRAVQWRRASRAPAKRHRAQLRYSYGRGGVVGAPWISIVDGQETFHQRVMWEPWVAGLEDELVIDARRVGRGPIVVDVLGFGRLWPAGRPRRKESFWEHLVAPPTSQTRASRLLTLVLSVGISAGCAWTAGWFGALVIGGYVWLLVLYGGGSPVPAPWLRPVHYPRIHVPGLALDPPAKRRGRTKGS